MTSIIMSITMPLSKAWATEQPHCPSSETAKPGRRLWAEQRASSP